jgi:crotonobetainyl-CoA:carnitine CoA-transferase CaiB-like acyl-CoA transferase
MKVLDGVRVVEQGAFISGPCAAMLLGDVGADVIKVERPDGGDPFRAFAGALYSPHYQGYNRNKRSIALDLTNPDDRRVFTDLIANADVFIQNFRPGVAERLGCGAAELRQLNPRLIYCSITGFGDSGPYVERPAYDTVAQAMSGYLGLTLDPAHPRMTGPAIADTLTGLYAAYGILGALYERERSGVGRTVDVSLLEAMTHFCIEPFANYFASGASPGPYGRAAVAQAHVYRCSDGKLLTLHLSSPEKFWTGLIDAIERPDLADDPRFNPRSRRVDAHDALISELRPVFATRSRAEWMDRLQRRDVPFAPAYELDETLDDPQVRHLGLEIAVDHPTEGRFRSIRTPIRYDGERDTTILPPPTLNEHGAAIRAGLAEGIVFHR